MELAREPLYVLETTPVLKVLDELRASRDHMLIVVDEHGDCEGLVTPMDVLTAVGGELPEHREDPREAVPLSDGLAARGRPGGRRGGPAAGYGCSLGECAGRNAGGLLLRVVGRIPDAGETIAWGGWTFEVTRRDGLRIDQLLARRDTPQ